MEKIRKVRIDLIFLIALILNAFFDFAIAINLSSENEQHLYDIYLYEILAILTFMSLIYNYKKKIMHNKSANFMFIMLCVFSVYYIALFFVRLISHNNYSSSMLLFRLFFSACTFMIYVTINPDKKRLLKNTIKIFLVILNISYLIISIKEKYIAPHFPDSPSVYSVLALISIPLCILFLNEDKKYPILAGIDLVNIGIMCISGCFSGSRAVFIIWCVEIAFLFISAIFKKQKYVNIGLTGILAGLIVLYLFDFNYCQASIKRVLNFDSYKITVDQDTNIEKDVMAGYDITKDENIKRNPDSTIKMDINYHNPTVLSNSVREVLLLQAIDLLKDDWLFSLKGNTELVFISNGEPEVSGAHNFLLDYTLAFGLVGTVIIAIYFIGFFIFTLKRILRNKNGDLLIIYLLILFAMGGMGFTQAVCSLKLPLILFCTYMAFIYINEEEKLA